MYDHRVVKRNNCYCGSCYKSTKGKKCLVLNVNLKNLKWIQESTYKWSRSRPPEIKKEKDEEEEEIKNIIHQHKDNSCGIKYTWEM